MPEIASRQHAEKVSLVAEEALRQAGIGRADIDAVAATCAPGLIGALLVLSLIHIFNIACIQTQLLGQSFNDRLDLIFAQLAGVVILGKAHGDGARHDGAVATLNVVNLDRINDIVLKHSNFFSACCARSCRKLDAAQLIVKNILDIFNQLRLSLIHI